MNRIPALILLGAMWLTSPLARAQAPKTAPAARPLTENRSLLWEISGKGLLKPSYLFGTIHAICPDDYVWTAAMDSSMKTCELVCFELDMDDPGLMMQIGMGMIDQHGKKLADYFTPEQYALISQYVTDSLHMNIGMFQQMKPAALLTLFATSAAGCAEPVSYEARIMELAQTRHQEVIGLEEASEQIALLNSIPTDSIAQYLIEAIKGGQREKSDFAAMTTAYKEQNLPRLYQLIEETRSEGANMLLFLDDRNEKWISRMEGWMEQKPVFFAVGAGHLWGSKGVISLLRRAGYTLRSIR